MKKQIRTLIYIIMALSLITCALIGVKRIQVESDYKQVEVAVKYSDVIRLSVEEEISLKEALIRFKETGVTTLLVKENTVASPIEDDYCTYKGLGEVSIVEGYILKFYYPELVAINPETRYIVTENQEVADLIDKNYQVKGMALTRLEADGAYLLEIGDYSSALTTTGVGFDEENLNMAADLGYSIALQLKNIETPDEESLHEALDFLMEEISKINQVKTIYFSDSKIPGVTSSAFKEFIQDNYQLGFIEFSSNKQQGFGQLAKATSELGKEYKVIRLHTLEDSKVDEFSIPELIERYDLALKERDDRVFLFKMPKAEGIEKDYTYIKEAITTFITEATEEGYTITGDVGNYNLPVVPGILTLCAGLGAIMAFILLLMEVGFNKAALVLGFLGIVGYAGLLKFNANLGCQLMALFGSIIFPTYGVIKGIGPEKKTISQAFVALLKICGISFGGALTVIGVLSKTHFALGIDLFMGVKLATTAPIILTLVYLIYKEHGLDLKYYNGLLQRKISYGALIVIGVLLGALWVYVSRSGNSGTTSQLELVFRQFLDNLLGVRPRTKEILIGYPILLAFLYYGYQEKYLLFMIFAVMAPISLVNTYAHIHTPVMISLIRSGYGILIGAIVGFILIWLIKLVSKVIKKWQIQLK